MGFLQSKNGDYHINHFAILSVVAQPPDACFNRFVANISIIANEINGIDVDRLIGSRIFGSQQLDQIKDINTDHAQAGKLFRIQDALEKKFVDEGGPGIDRAMCAINNWAEFAILGFVQRIV